MDGDSAVLSVKQKVWGFKRFPHLYAALQLPLFNLPANTGAHTSMSSCHCKGFHWFVQQATLSDGKSEIKKRLSVSNVMLDEASQHVCIFKLAVNQ